MALEIFLLVFAGGAIGLALAWSGLSVLNHLHLPLAGASVELAAHFDLRPATIAFSVAATIVSAVLLSLAALPSLLRGSMSSGFYGKSGRPGLDRRPFPVRNVLIALQISMTLALLVGAGAFYRSLRYLTSLERGFDHESVVTASLDLNTVGYSAQDQ